jgi:hypothetical protein
MEDVKEILEKITDAWNFYFWKNKFCQNQINFTEEVRTNYYGDILSYFNDTLELLTDVKPEKEFNKSIFQTFAILQIIYTHQDLIDELLYIFKLSKSTKSDKQTNREIRNELIGHPIRRKPIGNELISSVFFGREFKNGTIHYILYSKDNNFSGKEVVCSLNNIIQRHNEFLNKHLNIIWKKIESVLRLLKKKLTTLETLANTKNDFRKLVNLVDHYFDSFFKENYLFKSETLLNCFERQNEHPRYAHAIRLFLDSLKEYVQRTIKNIDEIISNEIEHFDASIPEIVDTYSTTNYELVGVATSNHLPYELSKLFEKHPVFGVSYFQIKFNNDIEVARELLNMKKNMNDDLEYYASYEYLCYLLKVKGYTK